MNLYIVWLRFYGRIRSDRSRSWLALIRLHPGCTLHRVCVLLVGCQHMGAPEKHDQAQSMFSNMSALFRVCVFHRPTWGMVMKLISFFVAGRPRAGPPRRKRSSTLYEVQFIIVRAPLLETEVFMNFYSFRIFSKCAFLIVIPSGSPPAHRSWNVDVG